MQDVKPPTHPFNPTAFVAAADPPAREEVVLRGGERVAIRPIDRGDAEPLRHFIEDLSTASRRFRFLNAMRTPSEGLLQRLVLIDPATDAAFVAVTGRGSKEHLIGAGRFSAGADGKECEFALTVLDAWQQKGLGTLLMRRLMDVARARGIERMHSSDAWDNDLMRRFAANLHLQHATDPEDATRVLYSANLAPGRKLFIELTQAHEVSDWCHTLQCTENELKAAIATVGDSADRVRDYLGQRRSPAG